MRRLSATGQLVFPKMSARETFSLFISAPSALAMAAAGLVVSAILSWLLPISHVERLDLSPAGHWLRG